MAWHAPCGRTDNLESRDKRAFAPEQVSEHEMAEQPFAVVCAWCNRIVNAPARRKPVTHTICPTCLERALATRGGTADSVPARDGRVPSPEYLGDPFRH